jgi:hypothetical protein
MADGYYGGAPNAFLGGMDWSAARRARAIKENALAALIDKYGPEIADPNAVATVQAVEQSAELHPLAVQEAQRVNAARAAAVAEHGAMAGDPNVQQRDIEIEERNNALKLQAGRRAAAVLQKVKNDKGDLGQAFDFVQQALPAIGIPPEHLATLREAIVNDPDSVDEFVALLSDPNGQKALSGGQPFYDDESGKLVWGIPTADGSVRVVKGLTPATAAQSEERLRQGQERLGLGWKNLQWDQVKEFLPQRQEGVQLFQDESGRVVADVVPGSPAEKEMQKNLQEAEAGDRKFMTSFETASQHGDVVTTSAQRALEYFSDADAGILLQLIRTGAAKVPGTKAYEANRALDEIRNNIGIDELQRMRQNSPTGGAMGNVSDRDIQLLTGALGQLEVARDPEVMRENLNRIVINYGKIIDFARQDAERARFRSQLREQNRGASFGPQPRPTPKRPASEPSLDDLLNKYAPPVRR